MVRLLMSPQPTLKPFCCNYLCDQQNGAACLKWTTTTGQFDASASPRPYRGPTLPRRSTSSQGNRPFKVSTVHLLLPELKSAPPFTQHYLQGSKGHASKRTEKRENKGKVGSAASAGLRLDYDAPCMTSRVAAICLRPSPQAAASRKKPRLKKLART